MKRYLFTLTISLVLTSLNSCSDSRSKNVNPFRQFISRLTVVNQFYYDFSKQENESYYNPEGSDSLFFNPPYSIIGLLPDSSDNYKILYLYPGDALCPYLRTFDKNGKTIDDQMVCFENCAGWDCEMDSCKSYVKLLDKKTIENYIRMITSPCDSSGKKNPATSKTVIRTQTISVDKNGKIIFSKEQDK